MRSLLLLLFGFVACAGTTPAARGELPTAATPPTAAQPKEPEAVADAADVPTAPDAGEAHMDADRGRSPRTPFPKGGPINSQARAIAVFRKLWRDHAEAAGLGAAGGRWSELIAKNGQHIAATRGDCGEDRARIESTLSPTEYQTALLYGELKRLEAGQRCWDVSVTSGFFSLLVYLRASDGEVLVIWAPPEG